MKPSLLRFLRIATFLVSGLLIAAAWLPLLRPTDYLPFGFAGIIYPIFLLLCLVAVAGWLMMKRKEWRWPLLAILLSVRGILPYFAVGGIRGDVAPTAKSFTVMTFNSSSMGLVNYKSDTSVVKRIYSVLAEASPDVLCIQEFYTNTRPDLSHHLDSIAAVGKYPYHYFAPHYINWKTWYYGTIVFSRFPILDTARIDFKGGYNRNEDLVKVKLQVHEDTISLLVGHFASYQLENDQYNIRRAVMPFAGRRRTKQLIAHQAEIVQEEVSKTAGPVMVAGDFNDVPLSYTYRTVRGNRLQDAWLQRGLGLGRTFSAISPTLRIDYLLPDKRFQVEAVKVYRAKELQHFPLVTRLSLHR